MPRRTVRRCFLSQALLGPFSCGCNALVSSQMSDGCKMVSPQRQKDINKESGGRRTARAAPDEARHDDSSRPSQIGEKDSKTSELVGFVSTGLP